MNFSKFEFSLQPRLDQLTEQRAEIQAALHDAIIARDDLRGQIDALQERIDELVKQLEAGHANPADHSAPRPAYELIDRGSAYEACMMRVNSVRTQVDILREPLAAAEEQISLKEQELAGVVVGIQSLEQLRDRQLAAWNQERSRAQQAEIDDAGIAAWQRKKPGTH